MQRLIFEFQKTCDNNLSFDAFKHKIENQLRTNERQKVQLDSLLGFENTKRIQEKKKREEMKQKKEEMEKKKKEDEEKQKRKDERAKKKKEEEQKKKEEENKAITAGSSTQSTNNPATNQAATTSQPVSSNSSTANPVNSSSPAPVLTPNDTKSGERNGSSQTNESSNLNSLKKDEKSTNLDSNQNKSTKDEKNANTSMISNQSSAQENKDKPNTEGEDKLDFSVGDMSVLSALEDEAKKKKKEVDEKEKKKEEEKKEGGESKEDEKDKDKDKEKDSKKEEPNVGEAIMKNEHYDTFKKFNKMIREDRLTVPETFLPDMQMKIQRQKAMNDIIELDPSDLQYLNQEVQGVRQTFEHFKKLVGTIKRLDEKVDLIEKSQGNFLVVGEDEILDYIKDYLETNEIAGMFLKNEIVRQTLFFEDFFEKIIKYLDTLSSMLKKRFFAFAKIEENCLTVDYAYLKNTMKKFSTPTLNLTQILKDIYTDLNSQILKYMLQDTVLLFETQEDNGAIKKYSRLEGSEDEFKITVDSTPENIKEYMDVLYNNAQKYFSVLTSVSKILTTIPLESKLEELQDYLENKMETLMKVNPQHYQKPAVLEILKKFDNMMNQLHEAFVFDMKGMAENIESTKLEENLKKRLLTLKNQMYTQMKALKDCADRNDYDFFQQIILEHFLNINKETQKVTEKKKGNQNKKSCLEVIVMNYQLFSSLIELFESELENKTQVHYETLHSTVKAVKEYFLSFIDHEAVQLDDVILQKALHTFTDIQFLECSLSDSLSKF